MQSPQVTSEAEGQFLSALPVIDEVLALICRRRRCWNDEAEEFASIVRFKLWENDCEVLRQFGGRSSLRTYLSVVIQRLFLDFRRQRWGIWRPCAEARRLGRTAERLDMLVNRDRMPVEQAIETVRTNEGVRESPEKLRAWVERLPPRAPRRAEARGIEVEPSMSAEVLVEIPARTDERHERACRLRAALESALAALPDGDSLALRMRFCDGLKVAYIADVLGRPPKPLYRHMERLQLHLREALARQGFDAAEFAELIGDPAFDDDRRLDESRADASGNPGSSPSRQAGGATARTAKAPERRP